MNELPKPMIQALELMEEKNIRVDEVPNHLKPAFDLCEHHHLAGIATRYGSEPTQPKQILKHVSELQHGDILMLRNEGYEVQSVGKAPVGAIPSGIQVQAKGCQILTYPRDAQVVVFDGPIPVRETCREYQINSDGEDKLNWHRMGESTIPPEPDELAKSSGMTWQEAAERMKRMFEQGVKYTSQRKLADAIGCSPATINNAIRETPSLHNWARYKKSSKPKAQSINEVVTDRTAQGRELSPDNYASINEYRETANEEELTFFDALPPSEQVWFLDNTEKHGLEDTPKSWPKV
jgi:biotin operon repressor